MRKMPNRAKRWIWHALRVVSIGCLAALLLVVSGEDYRTMVRAGIQEILPPLPPPHLYVLSIGINEYPQIYPQAGYLSHLEFAVADAQSVASAFSTKEVGRAFRGVDVTTLIDSAAHLADIRSALEHLISVSQPQDVVIFYFAGLGGPNDRSEQRQTKKLGTDYNFWVFDSTLPNHESSRVMNSFGARELSSLLLSMQARRQIIILDTSESSRAFEALHDALNSDSIFTLRDTGRRFALFGIDGQSYEAPKAGHGLLTLALLQAMRGDADTNHDGVISEAELEGYVMAHIHSGFGDEQLLSYSDLRGLCLSTRDAPSEVNAKESCDQSYGYDPSIQLKAKTRGPQPEDATVTERAQPRGTDYALILAGNTYEHWPKLDNPIYDAQILQSELIQNFGYSKENVLYQENPTKRTVHDVLDNLQHRSFGKNDRLFIYIAGHGYMNDTGMGFIVTRDTLLPAEDPYLDTGMTLSALRDMVDAVNAPHILIVLDVCYGGTFRDRNRPSAYTTENLDTAQSLDVVIANKMKSASRLYIASGGLRRVYDGDPGRHSPFARVFLKTLREYGGQEHLIDVGKLDGALYGLCPHPYTGTFGTQHEGEDFLFVPMPDAHKVPDPGLDAQVEGPRCSS